MKNSISFAFTMLFISFCTILFVNVIMFQFQVVKVKEFHNGMIHEIESSKFSQPIMQKYITNDKYNVKIKDSSVYQDLTIYQVTTTKNISIPIIGYTQAYTVESVAR